MAESFCGRRLATPIPELPVLLYVEDEVLIRGAVVEGLQEAGFKVLVATNGAHALHLLDVHDFELDGLLTDINMGEGPDGWQVARAARQSILGLPVVYVSAASDQEWTVQGVSGSIMLAKPFVLTRLVSAIESLIAAPEPSA